MFYIFIDVLLHEVEEAPDVNIDEGSHGNLQLLDLFLALIHVVLDNEVFHGFLVDFLASRDCLLLLLLEER